MQGRHACVHPSRIRTRKCADDDGVFLLEALPLLPTVVSRAAAPSQVATRGLEDPLLFADMHGARDAETVL